MTIKFNEVRRVMKQGEWHPVEKEVRELTRTMVNGFLHGRGNYIFYHTFSHTDTEITDILKKTFDNRKKYYLQKPWMNFHKCNIAGTNSPVRIPFRYIEEVLMVFSLLYSGLKGKKSYPILNIEIKKVMKYLKQHVDINTKESPNATKIFTSALKTFNQKLLTKYSYYLNRLPEAKLNIFFNVFFAALKESKVVRNVFVLSYDYFINEERDSIVLDACYLNDKDRRAFKFEFDSYYWTKDIFMSILATRYISPTPKKKSSTRPSKKPSKKK